MNSLSQLLVILLVVCTSLYAADSEPPTLEQILQSTKEKNGQIQEARGDIEIAKGQLAQANAAMWPKANVIMLGAPIFEEKGTPERSVSNWNKWGPLFNASFQLVQPITTFGQIGNYQKAAENQITARTELADAKRNDVIFNTKEIYYGYQMACDLETLVDDTVKFLEEALDSAEKQIKGEGKSAGVKPHDLNKLKIALEDLRQKKLVAKQSRQTAERAVEWLSAMKFETLGRRALAPESYEKKTMEEYLKVARATRPELKALVAGKAAREGLRDAKRAQSYPVLFIGAFGQYGWSPVRDKQYSVYANDPFNPLIGGIGLGLKFDLEFFRHSAEAAEQEGELIKLKATESYAVPGIDLQVKKAFWELEQAAEGLEVAKRRKTIAKKWFVSGAMGFSIGLTPAKDLLESLEGDALSKKNYVETVYQLNIALARLTQATGQEVTNLKY